MQETTKFPPYKRDLIFTSRHSTQANKLLSWFKEEVDFQINFYLAEKKRQLAEISEEAVDLVSEIERFIGSGGKRVRPAFLYSGYAAAGGKAYNAAIYTGLSVEFLHTFALIHDDIIDKSALRRGKLTSHKALESLHQKKNLSGDKTQFGLSAAILAGDLALSFAEDILTSAPFPQERLRRARFIFDQMKTQVVAGEYLDVLGSYKKTLSEEEIFKILEYKTAKYTVERPLQIGAMLAGAEVELLETFTAYGIPLGQAFQLQDDILGTFGDARQIGKPVDSDIREGKKTVLFAKAFEWSSPRQRKILGQVVGNDAAGPSQVDKVRQIIYEVGAYDYAVKLSRRLVQQAVEAVERAKITDEGRSYLLAATDYLLKRV